MENLATAFVKYIRLIIFWPLTLFGKGYFNIALSDKVVFANNTIWLEWSGDSKSIIIIEDKVLLSKSGQVPFLCLDNCTLKCTRIKRFRIESFTFQIEPIVMSFNQSRLPTTDSELQTLFNWKLPQVKPADNLKITGVTIHPNKISLPQPKPIKI